MNRSVLYVFQRALRDSDQLSTTERLRLWEGLAELAPENTDIGIRARQTLLALRETENAQNEFFRLLTTPA